MFEYIFTYVPPDPLSFWQDLHPHPKHGFFFGSGASTKNDHLIYMSAAEPDRVITDRHASSPLNRIQRYFSGNKDIPRFVGLLGFDAGRAFDPGLRRLPSRPNPLKTPAFLFGDYSAVVKIDTLRKKTHVFTSRRDQLEAIRRLMERHFWLDAKTKQWTLKKSKPLRGPGEKKFTNMVWAAKASIARGDIYQANLSLRFEGRFNGDPLSLYRQLCRKNPSPYAALLAMDGRWIVSCSPELLLKVENDLVVTRPIAGTRPRGGSRTQDRRRKGQLLLSPKERAEHIMLVDLERNDLGRVCRPGSVRVTESWAVEQYSHVMHIVSEVRGRLRSDATAIDALKSVFPGGTITGCPKIKSVEIIQRLEGVSRGPFYGSVGFFCRNGDALFNILIRTALIQNRKIYIQAGAGIVADSHPHREFREILAKARALMEAISK